MWNLRCLVTIYATHHTSQLSPAFSYTTPAHISLLSSGPCQDSTIPISLHIQPEQAPIFPSPSPVQWAHISQHRSHHELCTSMRSKIHALWHLGDLTYCSIPAKTHILLSTVYRIGHLPELPDGKPRLGHAFLLCFVERKKLIVLATSSASNRASLIQKSRFLLIFELVAKSYKTLLPSKTITVVSHGKKSLAVTNSD